MNKKPHEMLLELLAESLRSAGFECAVDHLSITVGAYRFHCTRTSLKTAVEFMGTMYRFTRRGVSPGIERAVQSVVEDLGWRLAQRKWRDDENAKLAEAERLLAEKQQRRQDRVEELVRQFKHVADFSQFGDTVKFLGVRVQVTDEDYIVTLRTPDIGAVMPMLDFVTERETAKFDMSADDGLTLEQLREEDGW